MKHTRSLINSLIVCAIAGAMISSAAAQGGVSGVAKVIRVKGPARYSTGGNVWQPLTVGTVVRPGVIVQTSTEPGSFVDLVLGEAETPLPTPAVFRPHIPNSFATTVGYQPTADQNVVRLWQNTALGVDKLSSMQTGTELVSDTQLDLKQGRITGTVKKMSAASKYEVKLPNGVAGIRGTTYDLTAEGICRLLVGSMVMAWVDPKSGNVGTQTVTGGQQYDARTGTITPISEMDLREFSTLAAELRVVGAPPSQETYVTDKTLILNVSPTVSTGTLPGPPPTIPGRGP